MLYFAIIAREMSPPIKSHRVEYVLSSPPPYFRKIWHYNRANIPSIKAAISSIDWSYQLGLLNHPDQQVSFFTDTLMNIFSNFIPHELKRVKPRDPPWFCNRVKAAYKRYNRFYRKYKQRGFPGHMLQENENRQKIYVNEVAQCKENYLKTQGSKLCDPETNIKTYWSILKNFTSTIKLPKIPPLFHNQKFAFGFEEKCEIFNKYFSDQCTVLNTGSVLPTFELITEKSIKNVSFSKNDILLLIHSLKSNKAHGWDEISSKMIKICDESLVDPLYIIFKNCMEKGIFPANGNEQMLLQFIKRTKKIW